MVKAAKKPAKSEVKEKKSAPKKVAEKSVKRQTEVVGLSDNRKKKIRELVLRGMSHGYVTQDDILDLFPDAEDFVYELDELYDEFLQKDIDVFESVSEGEDEYGEKSASDLEKELEVL